MFQVFYYRTKGLEGEKVQENIAAVRIIKGIFYNIKLFPSYLISFSNVTSLSLVCGILPLF